MITMLLSSNCILSEIKVKRDSGIVIKLFLWHVISYLESHYSSITVLCYLQTSCYVRMTLTCISLIMIIYAASIKVQDTFFISFIRAICFEKLKFRGLKSVSMGNSLSKNEYFYWHYSYPYKIMNHFCFLVRVAHLIIKPLLLSRVPQYKLRLLFHVHWPSQNIRQLRLSG